jgi:uncharacterized protein (DUF885 family)
MRHTYAFLIALSLAGCSASKAPASIEPLVSEFVYESLVLSPSAATANGYHTHAGKVLDSELEDYSPAGIEKSRSFLKSWEAKLGAVDSKTLDGESRADLELMRNQVRYGLYDLETIRPLEHNPTIAVETLGTALFTPMSVEYAPVEERFRHIIARLRVTPAFFSGAAATLKSSNPIWVQVALEENEGNRRLIQTTLREACPEALRKEYDGVSPAALSALEMFDGRLRRLADEGENAWRLGPEKFEAKFRFVLGSSITPAALLEEAEADLTKIRRKMFELALPLHAKWFPSHKDKDAVDLNLIVGEVMDRIAQDHSKPSEYFEDAQKTLDETRAFLRAHERELIANPPVDNLKIIPTPEFMRGGYGVGGFSPAPSLQPELGAYYWLTPIPADWPKERVESKLREYNRYGLRLLTIHEAIPGHYVQFEYANRVEPKGRRVLRSVFGSGTYVEGWAVYATEKMLESGYGGNPPEMQLTFYKQLLRSVANAILDIKLHTANMQEAEAMDLMVQKTFQEKEEAVAKWQRARLQSTQLSTYYTGYKQWLRLRAAAEAKGGSAFVAGDFHKKALEAGALPVDTLATLLGLSANGASAKGEKR